VCLFRLKTLGIVSYISYYMMFFAWFGGAGYTARKFLYKARCHK